MWLSSKHVYIQFKMATRGGGEKVHSGMAGLDPLFMALTLFRHRRFGDCLEICNELLEKNPRDQVKPLAFQ